MAGGPVPLDDAPAAAPAFGALLRGHRLAAGLTQEALAERAGLSDRAIRALERGASRPYGETARRLAGALALLGDERTAFLAAGAPVARAPRRPPGGAVDALLAARGEAAVRAPVPHNLPLALTTFVGREAELAEAVTLLAGAAGPGGGPVRLLTLTGPGGCGKTRLALQAAAVLSGCAPGASAAPSRPAPAPAGPEPGAGAPASRAAGFADGVWLVELGALADPALVPQAVAAAVGVREEPHRPVAATLPEALRTRRLLLVLDNCEHLREACARLAAGLLAACPALRLLATSRRALGLAGEVVRPVPPLPAPPPGAAAGGPAALARYPAVRLFADRAAAVAPGFALTPRTAPVVAEVCRRLDGLPLALELAAVRAPSLGVDQLAARLGQRFRLLTSGSQAAAPRQQTLRATVDWSYDLLPPAEQALFRRLAVFAGSFAAGAAEAVCPDPPAPAPRGGGAPAAARDEPAPAGLPRAVPLREEDVLPLLLGLVDRSLVVAEAAEPGAGPSRYRLLETLRQYADDRLAETGEAGPVRVRLLEWGLALAAGGAGHLPGAGPAPWLDRLEAEHPNLRAALDWALAGGDVPAGLRLAAGLGGFWSIRGHWHEGRTWLARGLEADQDSSDRGLRAQALRAAGVLAWHQGDYPAAQALLEHALDIARALSDSLAAASVLLYLGRVTWAQGDLPAARAQLEECLALAEAAGDRQTVAGALHHLAYIASHGDPRARRGFEESLTLQRALGDRLGVAESLHDLGYLLLPTGDGATARRLFAEALTIRRELGDQLGIAREVGALGNVALEQGDYATAWRLLQESLELSRERGARRAMAVALHKLGLVAARRGDGPALARGLQEQSLALCREVGDLRFVAHSLHALGDLALQGGAPGRAAPLYAEALALRRQIDDRNSVSASLLGLGRVAQEQGDVERATALVAEGLTRAAASGYWPQATHGLEALAALDLARPAGPDSDLTRPARLLGAADALRQRMGTPRSPVEQPGYERCVAHLRDGLGAAPFAAARAAGQALTPEQAVAYALEGAPQAAPVPGCRPAGSRCN